MYGTRSAILAAGEAVPLGSHPYSEGDVPGLPRYDCSYFAAVCLGLPDPGAWDTVTLVTGGALIPITAGEAQAGDFWGKCGPGTGGPVGHVALIQDMGAGWWAILEQTGPDGDPGPHLNTYTSIPDGYQLYRSAYVTGGNTVDTATVMALASATAADGSGYLNPANLSGADKWAAEQALQHNIRAVQDQITALAAKCDQILAALAAGGAGAGGLVPHNHATLDHTLVQTGGVTGPAIPAA